jgi:hypothetical protein
MTGSTRAERGAAAVTDPAHAGCPDVLREGMAPYEITISTERPLVIGPYTTDGFTCPHGVTFWFEPTGEQVARWQAEGTA